MTDPAQCLCKDCRHAVPALYWQRWLCFVHVPLIPNPVTGELYRKGPPTPCIEERTNYNEACGPSGRLFEPKDGNPIAQETIA